MTLLRRITPEQAVARATGRADAATTNRVAQIIEDVRQQGEPALRRWCEELGDRQPGDPLVHSRGDLDMALAEIPATERDLLQRTAERIERFARAQLDLLAHPLEVPVPGGRAGHRVAPVEAAGCYAPGGRFPLPSSVLMTAIPARVAGVAAVWLASPRPTTQTLAAAAVANADGVLAAGGAQAIAALAFGVAGLPRCDVVAGPGNRWVTEAKRHLFGDIGVDLLAGPSELVVLADETANPDWVAADLLAQAEHDPDAVAGLVTTSTELVRAIEGALDRQLQELPTAETARQALQHGFAVIVEDLAAAVGACNQIAPEHLEVITAEAPKVARDCRQFGTLFVGPGSAEVLGDYGAGPNHTLPTGGSARFSGGLSVACFLRLQTWIEIDSLDEAKPLYDDARALAEIEGLAGHARAAQIRQL